MAFNKEGGEVHWSLSILKGVLDKDFRYIHLLLAMQVLGLIYKREKRTIEKTCWRHYQAHKPRKPHFFSLLIELTKGKSFFEKNGLTWIDSERILEEGTANHRKLYYSYKGNWEVSDYILKTMCPAKISYLLDNFLDSLRERLNKKSEEEKVIICNAINLLLSHRDVITKIKLYPNIYVVKFPKSFEESQSIFGDVVKNLFEEGYGLEYKVDTNVYYEYHYRNKIQLRPTVGGTRAYYVLIYNFLNFEEENSSYYFNLDRDFIKEKQDKEDKVSTSNTGIKLFLDKAYEENEEEKVYYLLIDEVAFKVKFEISPGKEIKLRKFKLLSGFDIEGRDLEEIKVNTENGCSTLRKLGDLENNKDFKVVELRFRKNSIHVLFRLNEVNFHLRCSYNTSYASMNFYLRCLHKTKADCFYSAIKRLNLKKVPLIVDDSYPYRKDLMEAIKNCSISIEKNSKYDKFDIQSILLMMTLNKGVRILKQSRRNFLLLEEERAEELGS